MQHKTNGSSNADKETTMVYENLDEWLSDENKIITYRWLSLTLGLHVNRAKQILESFVNQQRNKGCKLSVTYCLGGLFANGNAQVYKVVIVSEELRQTIESTLSPPISCHIYSIQQSPLKSSDVLFTTDFDLVKSSGYDANKHSALRCQNANLRTLKPKTESSITSSLPLPTSKNSVTSASPAVTSSTLTKKATPDACKSGAAESGKQVVEKTVSKSNTGFSKLFGGAVTKPKADSSSKDKDVETLAARMSNTSDVNTVASNKVNLSKNSKSMPVATTTESKSSKSSSSKVSNQHSANKGRLADQSVPAVVNKVSTSSGKETKSKQESKKKETDSDKGKTKRRRIVVETSSSEDEEEVVVSPSPSPEPIRSQAELQNDEQPEQMDVDEVVAPVISSNNNSASQQNVRRKLVSKTYVNEEGFMVTDKVWENEAVNDDQKPLVESSSTSAPASAASAKPAAVSKPATMSTMTLSAADSSSAPTKKKPHDKKAPAKTASGKQASLMNFFQKK